MSKDSVKNEIIGLILLGLSFFISVACISYNSADTSLNSVTDYSISNIFGLPGSFISDLLLQFFGFGTVQMVLFFLILGFLYLGNYDIKSFWLRVTSFTINLVIFCGLISIIMDSKTFYFDMLPGGYVGYLMRNKYFIMHGYITQVVAFAFYLLTLYGMFGIKYKKFILFKQSIRLGFAYFIKILKYPFVVINRYNIMLSKLIKHEVANLKLRGKKRIWFSLIKSIIGLIFSNIKRKKMAIRNEIMSELDHRVSNAEIVNEAIYVEKEDIKSNIKTPQKRYIPPPIHIFQIPENKNEKNDPELFRGMGERLIKILDDFGVTAKIESISVGPVVVLFEIHPKAGTKSSRIIGLSSDIARSMKSQSARISIIPGKDALGIEIPKASRSTIYLRSLLEAGIFDKSSHILPFALGKDIGGNPIITDLAKMPHLLVAGTTGSGKSVGINSMIISLLYKLPPDRCKFVMIDPKMLELSVYDGIPHLLTPVITDSKKAVTSLKWVVNEMENRYKVMSKIGVRNIYGYNDKISNAIISKSRLMITNTDEHGNEENIELDIMPYIVVIIDEMADLMIVAGKEVETQVQRLSQMARAAGIHLIMATQRPSVDVITGVIKANFPSRISFQVTSKIDSRTILGEQGAEQLLGHGDMLFMHGGTKMIRLHGPFVSDDEVEKIVSHLKDNYDTNYLDITSDIAGSVGENDDIELNMDDGDIYKKAINIVLQERKSSISYIQRKLRIGYNKAANLVEKMEEDGILSAPDHTGKRNILIDEKK
jgi:S-DNA-T family DNA segregation ATPase FtsK/SpoIIIE